MNTAFQTPAKDLKLLAAKDHSFHFPTSRLWQPPVHHASALFIAWPTASCARAKRQCLQLAASLRASNLERGAASSLSASSGIGPQGLLGPDFASSSPSVSVSP